MWVQQEKLQLSTAAMDGQPTIVYTWKHKKIIVKKCDSNSLALDFVNIWYSI